MRISSNGAYLALELFGTGDDIFGERIPCQLSEGWPFHQRRYLFHSNPIQSTRIPERTKKVLSIGRDRDRERGSAYHHHASRAKVPYLAIEGDWRLIEPGLLRIPDVRRDDLVERQAMGSVRLELYAVFLGFNGQLTTDGILDVEDRGI
jgi:hypothetical protein